MFRIESISFSIIVKYRNREGQDQRIPPPTRSLFFPVRALLLDIKRVDEQCSVFADVALTFYEGRPPCQLTIYHVNGPLKETMLDSGLQSLYSGRSTKSLASNENGTLSADSCTG